MCEKGVKMNDNLKTSLTLAELCQLARVTEHRVAEWTADSSFPTAAGGTWSYSEVLAWLLKGGDPDWFFEIKVHEIRTLCRTLDGPCPVTQAEVSEVLKLRLTELFRRQQLAHLDIKEFDFDSPYNWDIPPEPSPTVRYLSTAFVAALIAGTLLLVLR